MYEYRPITLSSTLTSAPGQWISILVKEYTVLFTSSVSAQDHALSYTVSFAQGQWKSILVIKTIYWTNEWFSDFSKKYFSISHSAYTILFSVSPFDNPPVLHKPKYPAGLRIDDLSFLSFLHKMCLPGPVGPTILEKSDFLHTFQMLLTSSV